MTATSNPASWQRRLIGPRYDEVGSAPLWSLLYLMFLFMNWANRPWQEWIGPSVLSVIVFLPLYFLAYRSSGRHLLICEAAIAALGFALTPINICANTYLIYAAVFLPQAGLSLRAIIVTIAVGMAIYAAWLLLYGMPMQYAVLVACISLILAIAITAANSFHREKRLRQAELKLSHDEVRRLGALAERERIGRDLHDLLGHTLSLITLKSELAARLFDRDPLAARREILDVERVARDALAQVRRAVSGIRAAGLSAELAAARLLLESSDVRLDYALPDTALPPELETALALTVREAITNVQRHARATRASVEIVVDASSVRLVVADDGRGASIVPGNGLDGMRERLQALGGRLSIESASGQGTRLVATVPLPLPSATGAMDVSRA
jgi:two-component system sensor histidine kinase DesK